MNTKQLNKKYRGESNAALKTNSVNQLPSISGSAKSLKYLQDVVEAKSCLSQQDLMEQLKTLRNEYDKIYSDNQNILWKLNNLKKIMTKYQNDELILKEVFKK